MVGIDWKEKEAMTLNLGEENRGMAQERGIGMGGKEKERITLYGAKKKEENKKCINKYDERAGKRWREPKRSTFARKDERKIELGQKKI